MKVAIQIPQVGESITEVQIAKWLVKSGETVHLNQDIVEIDSDKTTLTISATASGVIHILAQDGETLSIGQNIAEIQTDAVPDQLPVSIVTEKPEQHDSTITVESQQPAITISPLASEMMKESQISSESMKEFIRYRVGVKDVEDYQQYSKTVAPIEKQMGTQETTAHERKKMSPLRKKIASRLVAVKNETAMLTTFNEIDMSALIEIRNKYKEVFFEKYGLKLGFMSFFIKAVSIALKKFPSVNAMLDDDDIVFHNYCNISIAVSTDKGLTVPVIRNIEQKSLFQIESDVAAIASKARSGKIEPDDLDGGTFTITNGGVFGSLLSTPILNPPQTAILGMHAIQDRAVVIRDNIVIRPMMYVALSYDHRLIDGKESVGFVVEVKHLLENPLLLTVEGNDPIARQLGL